MRKYIKETDFCGEMCQYAEQTINILKAEIDRLKAEKEALINGQETLQKYIMELKKKGNTTMKEITAITTIEMTEIHKLSDEVYAKFNGFDVVKAKREDDIKSFMYNSLKCDDVNVKCQVFVRDVEVEDGTGIIEETCK